MEKLHLKFKLIRSLHQWEESYLTNLLQLDQLSINAIISARETAGSMYQWAITSYNLGRNNFAKKEMLAVLSTCAENFEIPFHLGFAQILMEKKHFDAAVLISNRCIQLLEKTETNNSNALKVCLEIKNKAMQKALKKYTILNTFEPPKDYSIECNVSMDHNLFLKKLNVIAFVLESKNDEEVKKHEFAATMVKSIKLYNQQTSFILSKFVSKNEKDMKASLNAIVVFISNFPSVILLKRFMSFTAIDAVIAGNLELLKNKNIGKPFTLTSLVESSEMFQSDKSFFMYLSLSLECQLVKNIKMFCTCPMTERSIIITNFHTLTEQCTILVYLLDPVCDKSMSNKKLQEKIKKLLSTYKEELKPLFNKVIVIGMLASIYTVVCYKKFNFIEDSNSIQNVLDITNKQFLFDVFKFKALYLYIIKLENEINLQNHSKRIWGYIYEVKLFSDLKPIKLTGDLGKNVNYEVVDKSIAETLISFYISQLKQNEIDNPNNVLILDRILYCVLLAGGYHISVMWFLRRLKDFFILKDGHSFISSEDKDNFISMLFSDHFDKFKDSLDIIIFKIYDAQTYKADQNQTQNKDNFLPLLPQIIIETKKNIIVLPEFCNFIEDGKTIRANILDQKKNDSTTHNTFINKCFKSGSISMLKGILMPSRESIFECIKKSDLLIELLLNENDIPMIAEIKKSQIARKHIENACNIKFINYESESETNMKKGSASMDKGFNDKKLLQDYHIQEQIQEFKKWNVVLEKDSVSRDDAWRVISASGASISHIEIAFIGD